MKCPNCSKEHCIWIKTLYNENGTKQHEGCRYCWNENYNPPNCSSAVDVIYDTDGGKLVSSPAWRKEAERIVCYPNGDINKNGRIYV